MINLTINRVSLLPDRTIGVLSADGQYLCDTLEDADRHMEDFIDNMEEGKQAKIYGQTAIPRGKYNITMYWWKKHNNYYPLLHDVPFFSGILIHSGNTPADSLGCILVGTLNNATNSLIRSRESMAAIRELFRLPDGTWDKGTITIL